MLSVHPGFQAAAIHGVHAHTGAHTVMPLVLNMPASDLLLRLKEPHRNHGLAIGLEGKEVMQ